MESPVLPVACAPAERASDDEVRAQSRLLAANAAIAKILNAVPVIAMVLNAQRQLVLSNQRLVDFVGAESAEELIGLRPGELFDCAHAAEPGQGCGTTPACSVCGTLATVVAAAMGHAGGGMCRLRRRMERGEQALELDLWGAPIEAGGQRFVLLSAVDASDRVHREYLERSVIGQVGALASEIDFLATNLSRAGVADRKEAMAVIAAAAKRLTTLAHAHHELTAAERGELSPAVQEVSSLAILRGAVEEIASHPAALLRAVQIDPASEDAAFATDPALAGRVLAHMLANALEASPERGTVTAGCFKTAGAIEFWVHNEGEMTRAVQLQLFQRSFSTKGPGRGFGTYLMRMLAERYLAGTVAFRSTQSEGTTFRARYPLPGAGREPSTEPRICS